MRIEKGFQEMNLETLIIVAPLTDKRCNDMPMIEFVTISKLKGGQEGFDKLIRSKRRINLIDSSAEYHFLSGIISDD